MINEESKELSPKEYFIQTLIIDKFLSLPNSLSALDKTRK